MILATLYHLPPELDDVFPSNISLQYIAVSIPAITLGFNQTLIETSHGSECLDYILESLIDATTHVTLEEGGQWTLKARIYKELTHSHVWPTNEGASEDRYEHRETRPGDIAQIGDRFWVWQGMVDGWADCTPVIIALDMSPEAEPIPFNPRNN